ncbi:MAG: hypothetical protein AVDCRST_MAG51-3004, partial [uncultured Ramlibacter sp.]
PADPLKSGDCGQSLAALDAARADPNAGQRVEALRQQATQACLGGGGEARRPSPVAQPPLVVPPPIIAVPSQAEPPRPAPLPPPVAIQRPPVLTSCDAGGCWDSQGNRLNRAGPTLIGPGGTCIVSGPVVHCP